MIVGRRYLQTARPHPDRMQSASVTLDRPRVVEVLAQGQPFDRGPRRNVLVEDVVTGERYVRPFRGLRTSSGR